MKPVQLTVDNIAKAIFTVNRHAKTALNPSFLYLLKKKAIEKLLEEGKAKKWASIFPAIRDTANSNPTCLSPSATTTSTSHRQNKISPSFRTLALSTIHTATLQLGCRCQRQKPFSSPTPD